MFINPDQMFINQISRPAFGQMTGLYFGWKWEDFPDVSVVNGEANQYTAHKIIHFWNESESEI